jgi:hypothetical protein
MTAMVRAGGLRGYQALVRDLGGDPASLLRHHGLTRAALAEEDALIPLQAHIRLLEATAGTLNCPDFGLRLAQTLDIDILGPLAIAIAILSATTVLDAALNVSRYLFVHSTGVAVTIFDRSPEQPGLAELRYDILLPELPVARQWLAGFRTSGHPAPRPRALHADRSPFTSPSAGAGSGVQAVLRSTGPSGKAACRTDLQQTHACYTDPVSQ